MLYPNNQLFDDLFSVIMGQLTYKITPTTAADKKLTKVAPYNRRILNPATTLLCSGDNPFNAPIIIPTDPKFANDTRNTDIIPIDLSVKPFISIKLVSATNSFDRSFVAIKPPN